MENKEIITFTREQETLLIPLYAKAHGGVLFHDPKAKEILANIEYPFSDIQY